MLVSGGIHCESNGETFADDFTVVPNIEAKTVEKCDRIHRIKRAIAPLFDILKNAIGHRADERWRGINTVGLGAVPRQCPVWTFRHRTTPKLSAQSRANGLCLWE